MDLRRQIIINPHNLPGWLDLPLADNVGRELGKPAVLQNDANAAAFGEYWAGVGRGLNSLVQFTLGTGIGCGIVINGKLHEGEHSHGAEAGHIRIALDHPRYNATGLYGSLEAYASAKAVVERTLEALDAGQESTLAMCRAQHGEITAKDIFDAADAGDELGKTIVDQTAFYLAVGAVNLMHVIDPNIVVFSGGMIAAGPAFLERIRHYVKENALPVPASETVITYAQLGTDAGFIGAAGCARSKFATFRS
jgi:glucokinase